MATPAMKQVSALDVGRHMQVFQVTAANLNLDNSDATAVANLVKLVETAATFGNLVYIAIVSAKVVKIGYEYVAVVPAASNLDAALEAAFGTTAEFTTIVSA